MEIATIKGIDITSPIGGSRQEKHPDGTVVRFTEHYLSALSEQERKRYQGRVGVIRGYRLQDYPVPRPIVFFPKFGRYQEECCYERPWTEIELVKAEAINQE